jgi:dihydropyrimidinase
LAILADAPLYVVHVSAKGAMEAIRAAAERGVPVFGETCTHYLTLDTENLARPDFEGAKYVCSPALRSREHREALWQAVRKGWINAVSSDHCGFDWAVQKHMGLGNFAGIPNGCPGLQDRLGVLWTEGVCTGRISRSKLVELFATKPAEVGGIDHVKGRLAVGYDADVVLYDPAGEYPITNETRLHGVDFDPYEGFVQKGRVDLVLLRGEKVFEDDRYIGKKGQGVFVPGKAYGLVYR